MLSTERPRQLSEQLQLSLKKHPTPHFFEEAARLYPENTALSTPEECFTYRQLQAYADSIARCLIEQGIKPQERIAVFAGPTPLCVAALLGILKSGAVFVPLDPLSQKCQLTTIIEQAKPQLCLSEKDSVPSYLSDEIRTLTISSLTSKEGTAVQKDIEPQDPAHIVFTTIDQNLQGIVMPHRSLANLSCWTKEVYGSSRTAALASRPRCDTFVSEVLSALCAGWSVKFLPGALSQSAGELKEWIYQERIELIFLPLTAAEELIEETWSKDCPLKFVFVTGGRLKRPPVSGLPFRVINRYGHPECGTVSTEYEVTAEEESLIIPTGHPVSNVKTLVLDEDFQEVPHGTSGQLCIGGMGLALHYLDEALNHSRFVIQPRVGKRPVRLFLTGDLVKRRTDGKLELLGNLQNQEVISDLEVGLSAIESIIAAQAGILHVFVKPIATEEEIALTAYWVGKKNAPVSVAHLKRALKRRLPPHMVPRYFVELLQFPIGVDGKICHEQLPIPRLEEATEEKKDPPTNSTERKLLDLWESTLQISGIGIHTSLFELEITPSQAAKLHAALQQHFGKEIPLTSFYQRDTVARQAEWLIKKESIAYQTVTPVSTKGSETPLFCLYGFVDGSFVYHRLSKALKLDLPLYAVDITDTSASIEELAERAAKLIQEVHPNGPCRLLGEGIGAYVAYELSHLLGPKATFVGILDTWAPSRPIKAPLFRRLQVNTHHFFHMNNEQKKQFVIEKLESLESRTSELFGFNQHSDTEGELVPNQMWWTQRKKMSDYEPKSTEKELTIFSCEEGKNDPSLGWKYFSNHLKIEKLASSRRSLSQKMPMKTFASKLAKSLANFQASR